MKKNIFNIALLLSVLSLAASCIRDDMEECPTMHLTIEVKDKNYFNVDYTDLENRRNEDLPFREYVSTLHYSITNLGTGEKVFHSDLITVEGDDKVYNIDLPKSLPFGTYSIQVWGGLETLDPLEDDHTTIAFHPNNTQGSDIYLTCDTIVYSPTSYDDTILLERTKGKLIVQLENLPDGYEYSRKNVTGLYSSVNQDFSYTGETYVQENTHWNGNNTVTKTFLAPTTEDTDSYQNKVIHDGSLPDGMAENNTLNPCSVSLTVNRNELTVVRYVWDDELDDFVIYVLVNDQWECVHGMKVE